MRNLTSDIEAPPLCLRRTDFAKIPTIQRRQIMTMNRRTFSAAMVTGAAASLISTRGMAANSAPTKARNVVFVHGLFADGSCWSEVIARLQAVGLNVTSVQNPLTTLPEAVASAQRVLARQDGPTVFVGHSFSGMIVTEAGVHPNVSALVYVAARAPDAGEDYTALAKRFPTPPASAGIVFDGNEGRLSEAAFLHDFAGDLPEAKAKVLYAVQEPFQKALLTGKTTQAAWRSKPSFYAVSTEDRTINPDLERFMAKRMGATTIEVKAGHLSLISHPEEITQLILEATGQPS
jgi:pimeloyl-ACP methyl ester carboxylesterase